MLTPDDHRTGRVQFFFPPHLSDLGADPSRSSRERITALAVQHAGGKDILAWDSLIFVSYNPWEKPRKKLYTWWISHIYVHLMEGRRHPTWSFTQSFLLGHLMIGFRSRLHQNLQSITMTIAAYCRGPPFRLWKPVCLSNPCQLCLSLFEKCPQCLAQNNLVDCRQPRPHLNWSLETVYGFAQTWCIPKLAMFMRNMLIKITGFWGARCLDKPVWLQTTHTYFEYIPGILSVREHAITCHNHIVPQFWWDITS